MDDVNEKLNALLSDPGSMAQIMQLAQQLSGSMGGENTPPSPPSPPQAVPPPAPLGGIDPQTIARYLPLLQGADPRHQPDHPIALCPAPVPEGRQAG